MAKDRLILWLLLSIAALSTAPAVSTAKKSVGIYEIKRGNFSVKITNWGATVISVILPDSKGNLADVALGYDTIGSYVNGTAYFGATVGRVANRIGGARFELNGTVYRLIANEGKNTLHGGHRGFSKVFWTVKDHKQGKSPHITFTYHSFDGEQGNLADVLLGFDTIAAYINDTSYFGPILGRVANRIGGAKFTLNGTTYKLDANEGNNTIHGGHRGFSKVIWTVEDQKGGEYPYITLTYYSFDGDQGFPGALNASVTFHIVGDYELKITYKAKVENKATPVSLSQHLYLNLGGHNSGDILSNTIQIFGSRFTPVDKELIPTGEIVSVKGTPYDFLKPNKISNQIGGLPNGYDINYAIDSGNQRDGLNKVAYVKDDKSGRALELWDSSPGMQFYTANSLKNVVGKGGYVYGPHDAVCLEPLGFPDAVNHPNFPSVIVNPGKTYKHQMLYKFSF